MEQIKKYCDAINWFKPKYNVSELKQLRSLLVEFGPKKFFQLLKGHCTEKEFLDLCYDLQEMEAKQKLQYIGPLNPLYPASIIQALPSPAPFTYLGEFDGEVSMNLAVVGTRTPSRATKDWFENDFVEMVMSSKYQFSHFKILSGGAIGVDQLAHKAAIVSEVPTYCFLPCGAHSIYPRNLKRYIEPILSGGGALLSPFPPNQPIFRSNFFYRNRMMILMTRLAFVIEAKRRSGTMMTASLAANYGCQVVALPQFPSANTMGSLDLINDGVPMVRESKDLLFQMNQVF